jgi:ABC-type uncharacterized transport system ATPase subunit
MSAATPHLPELPEAVHTEQRGQFIHCTVAAPSHSQQILHRLLDCGQVEHFELLRPSLHDIFVRIALEGAHS